MLPPDFQGSPRVFMSNDTLLREVDEELRRDRMRKLWRQGAPFIIGAAVAVVLFVAGYEGWRWFSEGNAAKSSDQFYAAAQIAEGTDIEAAKKALDDIIATGSGAYPALAQFREASLLAQNGQTEEAVAAYDLLATSLGNTHLREVALVMAGNLLIDNGDVAAVEQRVGGSITPDSPMRNAAREVLGLAQYKAGQLDVAMVTFQSIIDDPLAGRDLMSRVQIYIQQLLSEGAAPIVSEEPAPADTSSEPVTDVSSAEPSVAVDPSAEIDTSAPASSAEISSAAP